MAVAMAEWFEAAGSEAVLCPPQQVQIALGADVCFLVGYRLGGKFRIFVSVSFGQCSPYIAKNRS